MDLSLTERQREIRERIRAFTAEHVTPFADAWDRAQGFPREVLQALGREGFLGVPVPERWGGAGEDYLAYVLVLEELSRADAGLGATVAVHTSVGTLPILAHGNEEQRERLLPRLARGELIGAFSVTEPNAGSDVAAVSTSAAREGEGFVLDGVKRFVSNGGIAGTVILIARSSREASPGRALSAFVLEPPLTGLSVSPEYRKLGLRSASTTGLKLRQVRVPEGALLGAEGQGFGIAMAALDGGRIGIAAQAVGIAQAALDVALTYATRRRQFGRRLGDFQAIQWKLADMDLALDAARLLTYRAAWLAGEGRPHGAEAAKAKLHASEVARMTAGEAVQILGGVGYLRGRVAERLYRDAKVTEIYEGTSEIQRLVIARALLRDRTEGPSPSR